MLNNPFVHKHAATSSSEKPHKETKWKRWYLFWCSQPGKRARERTFHHEIETSLLEFQLQHQNFGFELSRANNMLKNESGGNS